MSSPRRPELSIDEHVEGVISADRAVLGRTITLLESTNPAHVAKANEVLARLLPRTGRARRIGISGVPGVGKSTFIETFGQHLIGLGHKVAVLSIDPSSTVTGGSVLGDKTRMTNLSQDLRAFVRPSPSGGTLGGVAARTREVMLACEAAGYDIIIVESVGVGQSEATLADLVDFFLVLMLPTAGDELQGIKRGILEVVDMLAVNKADGALVQAAKRARHDYDNALKILRGHDDSPPVLLVSAQTGLGIAELWQEIVRRLDAQDKNGALAARRKEQSLKWMWSIIDETLLSRFRSSKSVLHARTRVEESLELGTISPQMAALDLLRIFDQPPETARD